MDAASRPPLETSALIDEILDAHRDYSEGDHQGWVGYRNHAQRVFLFALQLVEPRVDAAEQLAIAAAFHDIAVFRTVDYLVPNARAMQAWLARRGCSGWAADITAAITLHHRIRPYPGPEAWLVEPIRRADWTDVTLGRWHRGIDSDLVRRARRDLPMGRRFVCGSALRVAAHAATHPFDPFPFARSKRALRSLSADPGGDDRCNQEPR